MAAHNTGSIDTGLLRISRRPVGFLAPSRGEKGYDADGTVRLT